MKKISAILAGIALVAGAAIIGPAVGATPADSAHAGGCRTVTYPATLPWWQCINLTPGINKPGCFPRKVYTCY